MQAATVPTSRFSPPDTIFVPLLAAVAAVLIWFQAGRIPAGTLDPGNPDIYYSSDTSRVHANMHARDSNHWRTNVHPLFSILLHPLYQATAKATGADLAQGPLSPDALKVARILSATAAGIAAALFYVLLRIWKVRAPDALLLGLVFCGSAFFLYWFSLPETYPWGAIGILTALILTSRAAADRAGTVRHVVAHIASLAITTTNWMAGLAGTFFRHRWTVTFRIACIAFAVTAAGALVQKLVFPSSRLFMWPANEKSYVMQAESGGPRRVWTSIFVHTVVAPETAFAPHSRIKGLTVVSAQKSPVGTRGTMELAATAIWLLLAAAGVYALFNRGIETEIRLTLGLLLAGQIGLHTVYGAETFLYSAHYGPLFLAAVGLATRTRLRPWVLGFGAVLLALLLAHNFKAFDDLLQLLAKGIELNAAQAIPKP